MDAKLRVLLERLFLAFNSTGRDPRVVEALKKFHRAGYEVLIKLDVSLGIKINPENNKERIADADFLREMKIDPGKSDEGGN